MIAVNPLNPENSGSLPANQTIAKAEITVIHGAAVTFSSGIATYENAAITENSVCFVQRRAFYVVTNISFATYSFVSIVIKQVAGLQGCKI